MDGDLIDDLHVDLIKVNIDDIEYERQAHQRYTELHDSVQSGNVAECRRKAQNNIIDQPNSRGDTALHLAASWYIPVGVELIDILVCASADANARNKWGQTPLHYAAIYGSLGSVSKLLEVSNIDVNAVDVNGYTALQCCLCVYKDTDGKNPKYDLDDDAEFLQKVHKLIAAGASLNNQTKYGHTFLHLAASRSDNTPLLRYLLRTFPGFDLKLRNMMGENFLHIYSVTDKPDNVVKIYDIVAETQSEFILKDLLSDQDSIGRTPWADMIDTSNMNDTSLKAIIGYGVSVNSADNLGNTALHRIAGVPTALTFLDCLEIIIEAGGDINANNVFGETPASVLFFDRVFDVFIKHRMNFNAKDRWGRAPLMSIMRHRPHPDLLHRLLTDGKDNVNATDAFGSTPLHIAAYHNFEEQVELLLEFEANKESKDDLQDRPVDTARRHRSSRCSKILDGREISTKPPSFEEILLGIPEQVCAKDLTSLGSVQAAVPLPENLNDFYDDLLSKFYQRSPENAKELENIVTAVRHLVKSLCDFVLSYDSRFKMTIFPTGSSAENTKVGKPDEFDFVLCIDSLEAMTKPVMTKECRDTGYACLKFTEDPVPEPYLQFCDCEGYFLAFPFLQLFSRYLKRALNERKIWQSGNLHYSFEDKIVVISGKPVFNFDVNWIGSVYKQLKISIDLVPAIYKKGYWPPNINVSGIPMMTVEARNAGCFLLLQTRSNEFDTKGRKMNDNLSYTTNNDNNISKKRMLRVSAAPAEIALIKSLPENFRRAYILAKILKSKDLCPNIDFEKDVSDQYGFDKKFQVTVNPSRTIKSYMLKNCTFYRWLEMQNRRVAERVHYSDITAHIFRDLLKYAKRQYLNPFFLPYSDVFEFEKDKRRPAYEDFKKKNEGELSVKLILGMMRKTI